MFAQSTTAHTHILTRVRARALAGIVLIAVLSAGCLVVSLHPAYDDGTIEYDQGLLGTWKSEDDDAMVDVQPAEWRSYRITMRDGRSTTIVTGHLTRVGTRLLLDLMPQAGVDLTALTLPIHTFLEVTREGDTVSVAAVDYEALRARVTRHDPGISAVLDDRQNIVVSLDTVALRRWLSPATRSAPAFVAPTRLVRVAEGAEKR
jgi:hypothetical protein